jgi:hypothetical protein
VQAGHITGADDLDIQASHHHHPVEGGRPQRTIRASRQGVEVVDGQAVLDGPVIEHPALVQGGEARRR